MITIDYSTFIISVPKADTQFIETNPNTGLEIRQLNVETFAKALADAQDDSIGMWAPTAFEYTAPKDVGGIQLAPVILILAPYTVTFEDAQYAVNVIGGNTNLQDFTNVNQVSIRPSNSVGSTFSDAINEQSYQDASIWIDTNDGEAGITFPIGTPSRPVNNAIDAQSLATRLNLHKFQLQGTVTTLDGMDASGYNVIGSTPAASIIIMVNTIVEASTFEECDIVGSVTGRATYQDCSLGKTLGLTGVEGIFDNCAIAGTITLDATATEPIVFKDCISAIAGTAKPGLDCNSTAAGINFRRYTGGLAITNFNNVAGTMTLDLMGSEVSIDSLTCRNGIIVARGIGKLIDENGGIIANGTITINGNLVISNRLVNSDQVGSGSVVWTEIEKNNALAWSRNASEKSESVDLKIP